MSCSLGNLASGASRTVTVIGRAPPSSTVTTFTNLADVTSSTIDPDPGDNTIGVTVDVTRRADLAVTKEATPATVTPGETVTFPITVTNNGPSDAVDVLVTDTLDPRLTLTGIDPPCTTETGTTITCSLARSLPGRAHRDPHGPRRRSLPEGTAIPNTADRLVADT